MWRGTLRTRSSTSGFTMPCSRSLCTSRSRVRAEVMPIPLRRRSTIDAVQPVRDQVERGVARHIDLQRRHRDEALRDGVEVGSGPGVLLRTCWTNPVHLSTARIAGGHDPLRAMTKAQTCAAKASQTLEGHIRDIHIENERTLERACEQALHQSLRDPGPCLEVPAALRIGAQRDRN